MEQVVFDVHGSAVQARHAEAKASAKYALMTRASTVARQYHSPLLTEGAVVLHAVLECIVLGLSVSPPPPSLRSDFHPLGRTACAILQP